MIESDIKKQCKDYLDLNHWFSFPVHSQSYYAKKGISDRIAVKNGIVLFIEFKTDKGKQSKYQVEFMNNIIENGGHYFIVRSVEELIIKIGLLKDLINDRR